jgi:hypothetical protein
LDHRDDRTILLGEVWKEPGLTCSASGVASRMKATPSGKEIVISTTLVIFTAPTCQFNMASTSRLQRVEEIPSVLIFSSWPLRTSADCRSFDRHCRSIGCAFGLAPNGSRHSIPSSPDRSVDHLHGELKRIAALPFIRVAGHSIEA